MNCACCPGEEEADCACSGSNNRGLSMRLHLVQLQSLPNNNIHPIHIMELIRLCIEENQRLAGRETPMKRTFESSQP